VTVISVGAAWLVTLTILNRNSSPEIKIKPDSANAPAIMETAAVAGDTTGGVRPTKTHGELHLSAKDMLGTPHIMYGTAWKKDETANLVLQAIHAGFRFIDTACQPKHYDETGVGYGWKWGTEQLGLNREDLFLQTKFTAIGGQDRNDVPYDAHAELEDQVRQSVITSLRNLQTEYIDSLVLHSPMETMDETIRVWKVLEIFVDEGQIKQLGISNCYDPMKFQRLYEQVKVKPKVLQNRFYKKSNFDVELRKICKSLGVEYQSFWTLSASAKALASRDWKAVARTKGLSPQTLMYAFMMTLGHTPLSGTKDSGHMGEDVDVMLRFQQGEEVLDGEDMSRLSSLLGIELLL